MPRPRLGSIDVAVPLAATLRGGLLDELGWPALDEAVEELGAGGQRHWSASWPVLVVWNSSRAIAVGPGGLVSAGGVLHPGDRTLPQDDQHMVSDGDTCWTVEWAQGVPNALRELDPRTGEPGRFSLPSFFEDRAAPGV